MLLIFFSSVNNIHTVVNHSYCKSFKAVGLTLASPGLCYYFPELKTKVYLSHFHSFGAMAKSLSKSSLELCVITPYEHGLRGQGDDS